MSDTSGTPQSAETAQFNVLSLFAGIGGIDLGLERAGMTTVGQVEIDEPCQRVLARHWPEVPRHDDVRTALDWWHSEPRPRVHVVAGGYPCPAFSQAARGRNTAPDLWPHMRDVIAGLRPDYVLLENVQAHLGRGFAGVLADLHELGFDAEWSVVTACSLGASHPRPRLLAIAYPHRDGESVLPVDGEVAWVQAVAGDRRHWGVPTADDARADDGVPDRVDRVTQLGNAVVPLMAEFAGRLIVADSRRSQASSSWHRYEESLRSVDAAPVILDCAECGHRLWTHPQCRLWTACRCESDHRGLSAHAQPTSLTPVGAR